MDSRNSSRHRLGVPVAIALVIATFVGLVLGVVGFGEQGRSDQDGAGFALLVAILLVGGGTLMAQFAEDLGERLGPLGRRLILLGLALTCGASLAWGLLGMFSRGTELRCSLRPSPSLEQLETVLGDGPDGVEVFVPSHPHALRPAFAELGGLVLRPGRDPWSNPTRSHRHEGVTISTTLASGSGPEEIWGPTIVHIGDHGVASLTELWGPSEPRLRATWRGQRVTARIIPGSDPCGTANTLELRRVRASVDMIGPSIDQPLADFDGPVVGRTLDELELVPQSPPRGRARHVIVTLDGPRGPQELLLALDRAGRVEGWRLSFGGTRAQTNDIHTLFDIRFAPTADTLDSQGRPSSLESGHSLDRPDLRWGLFGPHDRLALRAGNVN